MGLLKSSFNLTQDLRHGARALRKDIGVSAIVVLILALGIGATTAIFSVVKAVLLDPLPYPNADRLVRIWESSVSRGVVQNAVSVPNFIDWRQHQSSLEQLAASEMATFNLTGGGDAERVAAARITANLLSTLRVAPVLGRNFLADEERPGAGRVVLLGHGLWQRRFGADPAIVARSIELNGEPYTVVGVMPPDFDFPTARELWIPLVVDAASEPWRADRTNRNLAVFGRLKPGAPVSAALADLNRIARNLEASYPASNSGWGIHILGFKEWIVPEPVRQATMVLFAAVGLLLLLTCANVANLLLARTIARQREIATHLALGATRARLVQQLLVESTLLAMVGGIAGCLLAGWGVALINTAIIPEIPRLQHIAIDVVVLTFALAVAVLTGLVFGMVPAWWASHPQLTARLKEGGATSGSLRTQRMRGGLVAIQIGLTVAVVISAVLLVRSFIELQRTPLGFSTENILTFQMNLSEVKYGGQERRVDFYDRWLERVKTIPGVVDAGGATHPPYAPSDWKVDVTLLGAPEPGSHAEGALTAVARAVTPGYFRTLGIPLKKGRVFAERSRDPNTLELVVSETLARRLWPSGDPVGKYFRPGPNNPFGIVIGVVDDVRSSREEESEAAFYFDYAYLGMPSLVVAVRTSADPERFIPVIRRELSAIDSAQPIYNVRTVQQIVTRATAQPRFEAILVGLLGGAALVLAGFGTYSMISYGVRQRRKEIAVRMALGASRSDIVGTLVRESMSYTLPGAALGVAGSIVFAQLLRTQMFRVSTTDPLTFTLTPLMLLGIAWAASYLPARRAASTNPLAALRND
jgi:putative ABC transport system permease protein